MKGVYGTNIDGLDPHQGLLAMPRTASSLAQSSLAL